MSKTLGKGIRMSTSTLVRLTAVLAALVLTSCAAEDDPVPIFEEPSAAPTPSASAAPEKSPHRSPKAVIRHWNHLSNTMQEGDTGTWREFTAECASCTASADRIDQIYSAGGYVRTKGTSIINIEPDAEFTSGVFLVDVDISPTEYREHPDAELSTFPGETTTYRVYLSRSGDEWYFQDFAKLAR